MDIETLDQASELRDTREQLRGLREAAHMGSSVGFTLHRGVKSFEVFPLIGDERIRSAIICACDDDLTALERRLAAMGVHLPRRLVEPPSADDIAHWRREAENWRRQAEMYARAWQRELGGRLLAKAHLIDALVLTTRQLRERAQAVHRAQDARAHGAQPR